MQLTDEFSTLPAAVAHLEVTRVSQRLQAQARFTDHVAVLTGRTAAEHLKGHRPDTITPTVRRHASTHE